MNLAPIVVFAYNRPKHLSKTLKALSRNELASDSILYIYCDGAKDWKDKNEVQRIIEVIEIAKQVDWPKELIVKESTINLGLAKSIVTGVTEVIKEYGKIIVLEDDLVTAIGFLKFMNDALDFYQPISRVMHVSGYCFPVKFRSEHETLFYQSINSWAWGTWNDRWGFYEDNAKLLYEKLSANKKLKWFDLDNTFFFRSQLYANAFYGKKTWAINWQASVNLKDGLSLMPEKTLVQNIGSDGSGENCDDSDEYYNPNESNYVKVSEIPLEFNLSFRKAMRKFYLKKLSTKQWLYMYFVNIAPKRIKSVLKFMSLTNLKVKLFNLLSGGIKLPNIYEMELERIGTDYGGWHIPAGYLSESSICYCIGAGEDISFDLGIVKKYGSKVYTYDPTPKAIKHIENLKIEIANNLKYNRGIKYQNLNFNKNELDNWEFKPFGIWDSSQTIKFYEPQNKEYSSYSALNLQKTNNYIEAQVYSLNDIMKLNGHDRIHLLKLDIEGAEYMVLKDILKNKIDINVLCFEFDEIHYPININYKRKISKYLRMLETRFKLVHVNDSMSDYTFISKTL